MSAPRVQSVTAQSTATARRSEPLAYQKKSADAFDVDRFRNLQLPLWLLAAGVVIEGIYSVLFEHLDPRALGIHLGLRIAGGTILMLVAVMLAARRRGVQLGEIRFTLLKLAAIAIAPQAAVDLFSPALDHIPLGGLIGFVAAFALYFALLGALFELDESDTWYFVAIIFLVNVATFFALMWLVPK